MKINKSKVFNYFLLLFILINTISIVYSLSKTAYKKIKLGNKLRSKIRVKNTKKQSKILL